MIAKGSAKIGAGMPFGKLFDGGGTISADDDGMVHGYGRNRVIGKSYHTDGKNRILYWMAFIERSNHVSCYCADHFRIYEVDTLICPKC
jgi:hypothetical protein